MSAWRVLLVSLAACGRFGFTDDGDGDAGPPDFRPNPIDWVDFENQSAAQTFTGINRPIDLVVSAANGNGTPSLEVRVNGTSTALSPSAPVTLSVAPGDAVAFQVTGSPTHSAVIIATNASDGNALLDSVTGTVSSGVTGTGAVTDPFVAPTNPISCGAFLQAHPTQAGKDGVYTIQPGATLDAYCDMTSDGGGWTLVARVTSTSTGHATAAAIGSLTSPTQTTTAKLADATINVLGLTRERIAIEGVGTIYAIVARVDLSGTAFTLNNSAAPTLAGPYTFQFLTVTGCSGDCGINISRPDIGFGNNCGYQYYSSAGNPRAGMGCQGNFGKNGTVWVR